jgi:membrane protein CcdC involved in cytochrome C biogenesis
MSSKLLNTILLSLAIVTMIIGIHRSIEDKDIAGNYWIFMIVLILYMLYRYRRNKESAEK